MTAERAIIWIKEEHHPYLWVVYYCLYRGFKSINDYPLPLTIQIDDHWKIRVNGKTDRIEELPPLGVVVTFDEVQIGMLTLSECQMRPWTAENFKQAIIKAISNG